MPSDACLCVRIRGAEVPRLAVFTARLPNLVLVLTSITDRTIVFGVVVCGCGTSLANFPNHTRNTRVARLFHLVLILSRGAHIAVDQSIVVTNVRIIVRIKGPSNAVLA